MAALGAGMDAEASGHVAMRHGTHAEAILALVESDRGLGARIVPELPYLRAEVRWAVEEEMATTLEDVLRRRTHVYYEAEDGGLGVAREVAEAMAALPGIGWGPAEVEAETARYAASVAETRAALATAPA
jgi:glycerol-3-phosphate dehydrogenase